MGFHIWSLVRALTFTSSVFNDTLTVSFQGFGKGIGSFGYVNYVNGSLPGEIGIVGWMGEWKVSVNVELETLVGAPHGLEECPRAPV